MFRASRSLARAGEKDKALASLGKSGRRGFSAYR